MRTPTAARIVVFSSLVQIMAITGCATRGPLPETALRQPPQGIVEMTRGDGEAADWTGLVAEARNADVIILGEQHDDAAGHAIQAALFAAIRSDRPAAALALEMLDRSDGPLVNAYLAGETDREAFLDGTNASKWTSRENWLAWYQPLIDAAKIGGHAVIAANAPRRLVTLARTEGYGALEALSPPERTWVDMPDLTLDIAEYEARFRAAMSGHGAEGMPPMDEETVAGYFRAQRVWDATMADAIAQALKRHRPVVMLVGRFHSDHEGGLVRELRSRAVHARILTVSIAPQGADDGEPDGRADFVIQTPPMANDEAPAP